MIIIIDFDGTIVQHAWPEIGEPMPLAFEVMKELQAVGHELILNTCRTQAGQFGNLTEAVEFCKQNGIVFSAVNENCDHHLPENLLHLKDLQRKIYGHIHIDDRNLGGFPGWEAVRQIVLSNKPNRFVPLAEIEDFYYQVGEDWHLWDTEGEGKLYPTQRIFHAFDNFIKAKKAQQ